MLMASAAALAGCGGSSGDGAKAPTTAATAPTPTVAAGGVAKSEPHVYNCLQQAGLGVANAGGVPIALEISLKSGTIAAIGLVYKTTTAAAAALPGEEKRYASYAATTLKDNVIVTYQKQPAAGTRAKIARCI